MTELLAAAVLGLCYAAGAVTIVAAIVGRIRRRRVARAEDPAQ